MVRRKELLEALRNRFLVQDKGQDVFEVGQKVEHKVFGTGTVIEVDKERSAYLVKFDDIETPRGISFRAKMEKH